MTYKDNSYCFITQNSRCPFLSEKGLCEIITKADDSLLCDVCAMHPRFFIYTQNFELAGLGLSCEKTVEMLLADKKPLFFVTDYSKETASLSTLLHALGYGVSSKELVFSAQIKTSYYERLLQRYAKTNPINQEWIENIAFLQTKITVSESCVQTYLDAHSYDYSKFFQYIAYRVLDKVEPYGIAAVLQYARESVDFIILKSAFMQTFPDNVRLWSEQIEYDTENVDILLSGYTSYILTVNI